MARESERLQEVSNRKGLLMAVLLPISSHARHLLAHPPAAGDGRHHWLFNVGASLHGSGWQLSAIDRFLREGCCRMGWEDRAGRTIDDIIAKLGQDPELGQPADRLPEWPETDHDRRVACSHVRPLFDANGDTCLMARDVLPRLFKQDDLICLGWQINQVVTKPLQQALLIADKAQFVVPNPMLSERAPNGSHRCKANASRPENRCYAVIEFDTGESRTTQAAVLSSLHTAQTPLVMAVWSAGKSIHGWYNVKHLALHQKLQFFRFASRLGADHSLYDMSKLVRMPGGLRDGDKQTILYFQEEHL